MSEAPGTGSNTPASPWTDGVMRDAWDYWVDACQRGALFLEVMQKRAERYQAHAATPVPHVLNFQCSLLLDGRKLPRPVNYALVRIAPPEGAEIDPRRRPFVVVDPRAGHGPGIGGFKADSEIGVASRQGTLAISSASCLNPCPVRRLRILHTPRQHSSSE